MDIKVIDCGNKVLLVGQVGKHIVVRFYLTMRGAQYLASNLANFVDSRRPVIYRDRETS